MKKHYFLHFCFVLAALCMPTLSFAQLAGKKIYIDPGHGTYTTGDRPMATIPYPLLSNNCPEPYVGFYESNTNLWKAQKLKAKLEAAGATVFLSRGDNESPALSTRAAEAESNGCDFFISIHSNATGLGVSGTGRNYPLLLFRGKTASPAVAGSKESAKIVWPYMWEAMDAGIDPGTRGGYSATNLYVVGDVTFYDSSSESYDNVNGHSHTGYLGVLKHCVPGFLSEGYYHDYQPACHRALNKDYCGQEGVRYYRGIAEYFGEPAEAMGYIMGAVKSADKTMTRSTTLSENSWYHQTGSNDQYKPINGAEVQLLQNGVVQKSYLVDDNYNGIFVFEDLAPGTYTVRVKAEGHKTLRQTVTVAANETTCPILFLEEGTDGVPVTEIAGVEKRWEKTYAELENKVVKRTLQMGDYIILLTYVRDGDRTPYLYAINHFSGELYTLSTHGIIPIDEANYGSYLALSDIAITDDNQLIGCNYVRTFFSTQAIPTGYKREDLRFYKWSSITAEPELWLTKSTGGDDSESNWHAGNFLIADAGYTMAVDGTADNCVITITTVKNYDASSSIARLRYAHITVKNNAISSGTYSMSGLSKEAQDAFLDITGQHTGTMTDYRISNSPLGAKHWVIDGTATTAADFTQKDDNREYNVINETIPEDRFGVKPIETNYVTYKDRSLVVAPYYNESDEVLGVRVCDVTDGFATAGIVSLNADLTQPQKPTSYAAASVQVDGDDFHTFLVIDNKVVKFSTIDGYPAGASADKGIYAYDLNVVDNGDYSYTFSFTTNDEAKLGADIIFYRDGQEIGRKGVVALGGTTETTISASELPGEIGDVLTWAVEVSNYPVREFGTIFTSETTYERLHATVDKSPESPYMGRIYMENRTGSGTGYISVYNADYSVHTASTQAGQTEWQSAGRPAVDAEGYVWLTDFGDDHGGVYVMDPATLTATNFFEGGTQAKSGIWKNSDGVEMGSSSSGCFVYGSGVDAKLFLANEDGGTGSTLPYHGYNVYNIGTEQGNLHTWNEAPSLKVECEGLGYGNIAIAVTSHGAFVSQNLALATTDYHALKFYDNNGECQYVSSDIAELTASKGAGLAVSPQANRLAVVDGSGDILLFRITWNGDVPTLTQIRKYPTEYGAIGTLNFDYAGNLVATPGSAYSTSMKLVVYAVPTEDIGKPSNTTTTPARKALTLTKAAQGATDGATKAKGWGIYAYDLKVTSADDNSTHTFSFRVNEYATAARLVFYNAVDNSVMGYYTLPTVPVPNQENTYTISSNDIPRLHANLFTELRWGVEVESKDVTERKVLYSSSAYTKAYNAVDNSPESDYFGNIYVMDSKAANSKIYVYDNMWNGATDPTTTYTGNITWNTPTRLAVDSKGLVYFTEYSYAQSGVYVADPANMSGTYTQFFSGTRETSTGGIKNSSTYIGGSTSGIAIDGTGEDTKMYLFNELGLNTTLPKNGITIYNIGDWAQTNQRTTGPDGNIPTGYTTGAHEGGLWLTSRGVFRVMNNNKGTNSAGTVTYQNSTTRPSILFFDYAGTELFNSSTDTYKVGTTNKNFSTNVTGTPGGGFAVTADESQLVINDGLHEFMVFNITWNGDEPTFSLLTEGVTHAGIEDVFQMNFDYAGNLIISGEGGLQVWSFPTGQPNRKTTPAKQASIITLPGHDAVFTNANGDGKWSNAANWVQYAADGTLTHACPAMTDGVLITQNCTVDADAVAEAKTIDINENIVLTIAPTAKLTVAETIQKELVQTVDDQNNAFVQRMEHNDDQLVLQADANGQAILIHGDKTGHTPATVQMHGPATQENAWQYVALPFQQDRALTHFQGSHMAYWNEPKNSWAYVSGGTVLSTFTGYLLAQAKEKTYTLQGYLPATVEHTITNLTAQGSTSPDLGSAYNGANFLGNSWTAPLQIDQFDKDADFTDVDATIYIYKPQNESANGDYHTITLGDLPTDAPEVINPLQAFFVYASADGGSVTLDYDRLTGRTQPAVQTAPRRTAAAEKVRMNLCVTGEDGFYSNLQLVEHASYTTDFDNGYDGRKMMGDAAIPYLAAATSEGDMAVLATPTLDGTFLNFHKGTDATTYTFTFQYDGTDDYLLEDAIAGEATTIRTGNTYTFTSSDDDSYRFRVVRAQRMPDITTDVPNVWATGNKLYMTNPLGVRTEVSIYTADGKLVKQTTTCDAVMQLQVPNHGVYIIQVRSQLGVQTVKHIL